MSKRTCKQMFVLPSRCLVRPVADDSDALMCYCRRSYWMCFIKKDVLRNFAKFTRKHLRQSLFFNKGAVLRPATLLKKRLWYSCEFCEIFKNTFFTEHLQTTASVAAKNIYDEKKWLCLTCRKVKLLS